MIYHANSASIGEYWLVCHGIEAHDLEKLATTLGKTLGYDQNANPDSLNQVPLASPEDVLAR